MRVQAILEAVLLVEGPIGSARSVARRLALGNRFTLARLLKSEGLPSLHQLAKWASLLSWVGKAERDGVSLSWIAYRSGRHASTCHRQVRELTGLPWSKVRARGSDWVQRRFLDLVIRSRRT